MKHSYALPILCCIFFSGILIASPIESYAQKDQPIITALRSSSQASSLQISLLTDKTSYSIGDEIHLEVVFFNRGNSPLRILIDDTFVGGNIQCTDMEEKNYSYEGGYRSWSPKAGLFTGRTYFLKPSDKINIKMDALVYDNYKLIFSNLFDRKGSNNYKEFKKNKKLPSGFPDKYICAGRIFSLLKPNKYRLTYIYETTNADKHWKFSAAKTPQETSLDLLWIGKATSNTIEISIQ
ncbi:MAG: hypothetical protein WAL98_12495 [Desulfatiglandaceae bacterium]|jgi:hypothetical protein